MDTLEGQGFVLRKWKLIDATSLAKHGNNTKIAENLRDGFPSPYTIQDAQMWIEMMLENRKDLVYAIEIDGEACGGIGLHAAKDVYRFNAELGYWLSEKYWGKGIITDAVGLMVNYAFTRTNWIRVYAGVFSKNLASMKVLEKNGFQKKAVFTKSVKKQGVFMDEHIYSILKEDWEKAVIRE